MDYKEFEQELVRAYRILGIEKGYWQNCSDIEAWYKDGYIDHAEKARLQQFNQRMCK